MDNYTPTPNFYDDYIAHYGVKGMKWRYHKPKASPTNSDAYNQLAAMKDDEYQAMLKRIKLTKGGKGKSTSSKTKGTGKKAAAEKKSSASTSKTASSKSSSSSTPVETKKKSKWKEEEVNVEIRQPNDILEKIRKGYKPKKTRVRT